VVEGLNAALIVSGSTAREASAALLQLGQGLASDNLSGEELRSLRENLPQLAQGLAKELGFSIGALKELGRQGKLTAETVFPALERAIVKFQDQLERGEVIFTFAQAFNVVRNAVIKAFTIIQRSTPLTQELTKAIFSLADGLAERLVNALADAVEFTIDLVGRFETVATAVGDVSKVVGVLVDIFLTLKDVSIILIDILVAPFALAQDALNQFAVDVSRVGRFFGFEGFFTDEVLARQNARVRESKVFIEALLDDIGDRSAAIGERLGLSIEEEGERALTPLQKQLQAFADAIRTAAANPPGLADDPDRPFDSKDNAADLEAAVDANKELLKIVRLRRLEELAAINPRLKQIALIDEEIANIARLVSAGADRILAEREINDLIRERAELAAMTDFGQGLATGISESFQQAFASAIKSGEDFTKALSTNLENAANNALVSGFDKAFEALQEGLGKVFDAVANQVGDIFGNAFGALGPVLGEALSGALQFVALQAISALLGGAGNDQRSSGGNVQSAVTSTQAVRGIVAGPTEVAIANVGRNIAEAIDPLLQETIVQTGLLRGILANGQAGTAASGGDPTGSTVSLAFGSAPAASA
jgi:tape measure domain-containing protein